MTKQKITLIALVCVVLSSLLLSVGAFTYSWYSTRISDDKVVEVPADGYLVVGFTDNPIMVDGTLTPAIAMDNAVRDNKYMDPLRVYSESDPIESNVDSERRSYIKSIATSYTHVENIEFYEDPTSETDNYVYDFVLTAEAFVKIGEEQTRTPINTPREIDFSISIDVDYDEGEDIEDLVIIPEVPFQIDSNATITITITTWLALPDELCDPLLISNQLFLEFGIGVTPRLITTE